MSETSTQGSPSPKLELEIDPPPLTRSARLARLLDDCREDPARFNDVILGRSPYWAKQLAICESVVKHRITVVVSGNGVGKSFLAAGLVLWFLHTRHGSLSVTTAPSQLSIGTIAFKEVRRAHAESLIPLGGDLTDSPKASPQVLRLDLKGWQAVGLATRGIERISGQHAGDLLVIVDEASGVEEEIFEALYSLNPSKMVVFGNPIRADGEFRELAKRAEREQNDPTIPEHSRVHLIRIASTESPDAHLERSPRGMADAGWLADMARKFGRDSMWWRSHVDALFPEVVSDNLIPDGWLIYAESSPRPAPSWGAPTGPARLGVDLGEGVGRDATALVVRDDLGILELVSSRTLTLDEAALEIARLRAKYSIDESKISYDRLGVGKDLANRLARHKIYNAVGYAGSGRPQQPKEFTNLRTEAAWNLRRRLDPTFTPDPRHPQIKRPAFAIPQIALWPRLREELAALTYDSVGRQTRLIQKDALKELLGRSPDLCDALLQTFAFP